ncbi:PREDICTED: tripeptidyl-peptidase 2 [Nicrophorus vespilloides]|uniref:Tripeptidyl-peptidase 2 n=1 Tax=Nicrophorus vespilloides TaxID=110193 RepID=A0ABM1M126_NICVS|nr:PREDICTED: tripeptidyl-peptidase 2 [Nicrophorus vespilloides]
MENQIEYFPVWGLLPKKETGIISFLSKYEMFDGKDATIAIFDSGIDPGAPGLQETPDGKIKVIERFDCSGCGDVTMTHVVVPKEGHVTGLSGRQLKIPESWENPSNTYRVGIKNAYDLYPERLRERVQDELKEKNWDEPYKMVYAEAVRKLSAFELKMNNSQTLTEENRLEKENLEAIVEHLITVEKKFYDWGIFYDCIMFYDGAKWVACVDTTEEGDLEKCPLIGEYSITHDYAVLSPQDQLNFSMNVYDYGNTLELVGLYSSHGTHVASIASAYFPNEPEKNGVAPGAQIVSLTIGDGRLNSMETGTALVRAMIKVMELGNVDVINMSYGEHAHWSNTGRIGDLMNEVVNKYGITWVASAGNHGPALSTIGTPPDISQETIIGVGAYVSPDMMVAEYAMRKKMPGMPYTWSSRGPTIDGGMGVTVCAPGGAITSVPNCTLRNSQLMNGTSMAAPHVAGAVALLISGMKQRLLKYSPYNIKRALENGATYLNEVERFAQGSGLLNVEKSFDLLLNHFDALERDVRFQICCGPDNAKGIYIRNKNQKKKHEISVSVEPFFLDSMDVTPQMKINFNLKLALVCKASYVQHPKHLDLSNLSRVFSVQIDTAGLDQLSSTVIEAYDVNCVAKGPVFKILVTVIVPKEIDAPQYSLVENNVYFEANTIKRNFIVVPEFATWAVIKLRACEQEDHGKFIIHCMHILPKQSCKTLEMNKHIPVSAISDSVLSFQVRSSATLEVVIAKYWANIGNMNINYSITFHGIQPNQRTITMLASDGIHCVEVTSLLGEEIVPSIILKNAVQILRPTESKISPLTERDVIPKGRQIYELISTFNFHLNKGTEVSPNYPMLSDVLYESEFEAQLWILYDSNKQYLGSGDAYYQKYLVKLDKGDYVIKLQVRHEKKEYLERLTDAPLLLNQKMTSNITMDVYKTYSQAITNGKKASIGQSNRGPIPLYIAPLPTDKYTSKNNNMAHYLTGTVTYAKDELGKKTDVYTMKYVLGENNKKSSVKSSDKDKTKWEEYLDALRDVKVAWLAKLGDAPNKLEALYNEILGEFPDYIPTHSSYLQALEAMDARKQIVLNKNKLDELKQVIEICDNVIENINQDSILINNSIKCDQRPEAGQIKLLMERQKTVLIDCLCRKGISLCRLSIAGKDRDLDPIQAVWKNLLQIVDPNDKTYQGNVVFFALWHARVNKNYGRMAKYLMKINEEKSTKEIEEALIEVYEKLGWDFLVQHTKRQLLAKYPNAYRPF